MRRTRVLLVVLLGPGLCAGPATAADKAADTTADAPKRPPASAKEPAPLGSLSRKIAKNLERGKWSAASKAFTAQLWQEYKQAWLRNRRGTGFSGHWRPDIKSYDDYVAKYAMRQPAKGPALEVFTDGNGRFIVKLEGHEIPAVAHNRSLLVTTGDVVRSHLPAPGGKPHATLEYFLISRIKGEYYLSSPGARSLSEMQKIQRLDGEPAAQDGGS